MCGLCKEREREERRLYNAIIFGTHGEMDIYNLSPSLISLLYLRSSEREKLLFD